MSNTATTPATPAAGTTNSGAVEAEPTTNVPAQPAPVVSLEDFNKLARQVGFAISENKKLAAQLAEAKQAPPQAKLEEELTVKEEIRKLREGLSAQEKAVQDRMRAAEQKDKDSALKSALGAHGLGEFKTKVLFNHLKSEHGADFVIENDEVLYRDQVRDEKISVSKFVSDFLNSAVGDGFKAAPAAAPETKGLGVQKPSVNTGRKPMSEWTKEDQDALIKSNPNQFFQFVKEDMGRA